MTRDQLLDYFLHKPGTYDDKECEDVLALNLASESVCKINLHSNLIIDLKCNQNYSKLIQNKFSSIEPGKTEGKFQWNRIIIESDVSDYDLYELIDYSYDNILTDLPAEEQKEILDLEL